MRIKFQQPDPRAGTTAQMDSSRGQYFIDTGAAVQLREDGTELPAFGAVPQLPVSVKPSEGLTVAQLKEALEGAGIEIPDGVTKKPDLAALLDAEVK